MAEFHFSADFRLRIKFGGGGGGGQIRRRRRLLEKLIKMSTHVQ